MNLTSGTNESREFEFTDRDFERVSRLIYRHAGISLSAGKQEMVYSRLARRLRAKGLRTFGEYLAVLESGVQEEWEAFTNSLTTNLTSFFREEHHFPILARRLVKRCEAGSAAVWCCAASTGEEPYSIAMTAVEALGTYAPPVHVVATDVDTQVLGRAEAGIYAAERIEKMPRERVQRFFLRGAKRHAGMVRVRRELQELITFRQVNLRDPAWPVRGPFDAIFCRNVMIYFDKKTQREILMRFLPLLRPGGLLFAGHSESFHHAADLFRPCGKTVYAPVRDSGGGHG